MATTWGHTGRIPQSLDDEPDDILTTTLGDLISTYGNDVVLFFRVEVGTTSYHLLISNDPRAVPQGTQVLVK
jgi:hypothetical protein